MTDELTRLTVIAALRRALAEGRSPIDEAIYAWDRQNPTRSGFAETLLELVDMGVINGVVYPDRKLGSRKVLSVTGVSEDYFSSLTSARPVEQRAKQMRQELQEQYGRFDHRRAVFVIYGRDNELQLAVFDFLRVLDLQPIEWPKLITGARSLAPSITDLLNLAFEVASVAVVILAPEEFVALIPGLGSAESGYQSRPNVLFEAGMALGRNPENTLLIEVGEVRKFSDISGLHVVRIDETNGVSFGARSDIAQRLRAAKLDLDMMGKHWMQTRPIKPFRQLSP